jgi:hypothetical protein
MAPGSGRGGNPMNKLKHRERRPGPAESKNPVTEPPQDPQAPAGLSLDEFKYLLGVVEKYRDVLEAMTKATMEDTAELVICVAYLHSLLKAQPAVAAPLNRADETFDAFCAAMMDDYRAANPGEHDLVIILPEAGEQP